MVNNTKNVVRRKNTSASKTFVSIAPGEGKLPVNILRNENWDWSKNSLLVKNLQFLPNPTETL